LQTRADLPFANLPLASCQLAPYFTLPKPPRNDNDLLKFIENQKNTEIALPLSWQIAVSPIFTF